MQNRGKTEETIVEKMLLQSYENIKKSVIAYGMEMPTYEYVKEQFYNIPECLDIENIYCL